MSIFSNFAPISQFSVGKLFFKTSPGQWPFFEKKIQDFSRTNKFIASMLISPGLGK